MPLKAFRNTRVLPSIEKLVTRVHEVSEVEELAADGEVSVPINLRAEYCKQVLIREDRGEWWREGHVTAQCLRVRVAYPLIGRCITHAQQAALTTHSDDRLTAGVRR